MSTTTWCSSRSARSKVASTTYVARWSPWAGPKNGSGREWAIMTWSRTVREYTCGFSCRWFGWSMRAVPSRPVADDVAQPWLTRGEPVHEVGQVLEAGRSGEQVVEGLRGRRPERDTHPSGVVATRGAVGADPAHLARAHPESPAVEVGAQVHRDGSVAIPGQLDHLCLLPQQPDGLLEPFGGGGAVEDHVAVRGGVPRPDPAGSEQLSHPPALRVRIDQLQPFQRKLPQQRQDAGPDHASADHRDPVAVEDPAVPQGVDGGLEGAQQDGPLVRELVGQRRERGDGHDIQVLVRMQAEHPSAEPLGGPFLDPADREVAVLDRSRELAVLERGAHLLGDGRGHATPVHE